MFVARENDDKGMQVLPVKDSSAIRRIQGTPSGAFVVHKLKLKKQDGSEVVTIDTGNIAASNWSMDQQLGELEEILGVYGSCRQDNKFQQLGLIVWQPPRL